MSEDITKNELVGVSLSPQILSKIDERTKITGVSRQEVIRRALINDLFESC